MLDAGQLIRRRRFLGSSLPYIASPDLFAWDFTNPVLNGSTISSVPEMSRGASHAWEQPVAASQPTAVAEGARFITGGASWFDLASPIPLNGSTGIYTAFLFQLDAASTAPFQLVKMYDGINSARAGRYRMNLASTAAKRPESFIDLTDGNVGTKRITPTTTIGKGTWYLFEHWHDFRAAASPAASYKEDQVSKAANLASAFATTSYPSTDSLGAILGINIQGTIKAAAIFDGNIPADVETSVSDWMQGIHP